ncbi:sulfotransferase 2A1-like [Ambystoma mexicanum]|uniref:sulfotransferase 2A1-like n=1 Tax=Ambystoma mexicanum TaxID=8296 RepID=UPI0037E8CC12
MADDYFTYKGILFHPLSSNENDLNFIENEFQVLDDDIFNITYPKSGTTWLTEILSLIRSKGDPTWSKTVPNWERSPWIEVIDVAKRLNTSSERPPFMTSHLAKSIFPRSLVGSKAKVIYTVRNPKDVLVSLYYFAQMTTFYKDPESFEQFLELFLKGEVPFGSWFDHVNGWMELNGQSNFLLLCYDDLLQDLRGGVVKICKFLGQELDDETIDLVTKHSLFKNMKENKMANFSLLANYFDQSKSPFMRKGISGDWKNHFTVKQAEHFDHVYQERMNGFHWIFPWDKN